jgi:hypothetical protein
MLAHNLKTRQPMLTASARPFDTSTMLDGLRVDGKGAHAREPMSMSSIDLLHRFYQTLR